ncbi:amphi-Trp domain-containing protein [Prauserella sp. PE36]|nr:amphi-Trp domain-containing protein [Prauserella sp. PE36]
MRRGAGTARLGGSSHRRTEPPVSDVEVKRTESLTRQEAARRLAALAEAMENGGGHVELALGVSKLKIHVPDEIRCEMEVEVDGDEVELEVELKWSTSPEPEHKPARGRAKRAAPAST